MTQFVTDRNGPVWDNATGKLIRYQDQALKGLGAPSIVELLASTGETAAKAATDLFTPAAAGLYAILLTLSVTTVGTAGTIRTNLLYTDPGTTEVETVAGGESGTITAKVVKDQILFLHSSAAVIQWSTTFTGVTGFPVYNVRGIVLRLS